MFLGTFDVTKYGDTPDIKLDGTATGNASSFVINTDETFIADDNFLIGLGQLDDKNNVVPSAVVRIPLLVYHYPAHVYTDCCRSEHVDSDHAYHEILCF